MKFSIYLNRRVFVMGNSLSPAKKVVMPVMKTEIIIIIIIIIIITIIIITIIIKQILYLPVERFRSSWVSCFLVDS